MVVILSKINVTSKNLILLVSNIYHIFHLMLESSVMEGWIPLKSVIRGVYTSRENIEYLRQAHI